MVDVPSHFGQCFSPERQLLQEVIYHIIVHLKTARGMLGVSKNCMISNILTCFPIIYFSRYYVFEVTCLVISFDIEM